MNSQQVQQQQQLVSPSQQLPPPSQQIPVITSISGGPLLPTLSSPHHVLPHLVSESNQSLQAANAPWGVSVNVGMAAHHVDTNVSGMPSHHHEQVNSMTLGMPTHHDQVSTLGHHPHQHDNVNAPSLASVMQGLPQSALMGVTHSSLSDTLMHHHDPSAMSHMAPPALMPSDSVNREMGSLTPSKHSSALSVGLKQEKSHIFFHHYLVVGPHLAESTLAKSLVYALYRRMMPEDFRYDFANFANALYDWAYLELIKQPGAAEAIEEAIRRFEQNKQTKVRKPKSEKVEDSGEEPPRKRQRKKKTAEDETKDKVKNILRNSQTVPFVALRPVEELDTESKFAQIQPDHIYSAEQLHEWEMSPGTDDFKQSKNVKISLPYAIKEDDTQYVVFVNVPFFPQSSLTAWATNTQVVLEGTITLPPIVDLPNKQIDINQLSDVEVPRHNQLHLGKFRQAIDLPKPINPPCCVLQESGLVIVGVDKQVFTVNKTIL